MLVSRVGNLRVWGGGGVPFVIFCGGRGSREFGRGCEIGGGFGVSAFELELVEALVERAGVEEFCVISFGVDLACDHDDDLVGVDDGGEAVGDGDDGFALLEGLEGGLDFFLGLGVEV